MRNFLLILAFVPVFLALPAKSQQTATGEQELMNRASTAFGISIARDLLKDGIKLDSKRFAAAFDAVAQNKPLPMTDEQMAKTFQELREFINSRTNADNANYLIENKKREEVTETKSGLQYEVLKASGKKGPKPKATDRVKVHYEGKLVNGKVFDSSIARGEPLSFGLSDVISGWTEGLQLMSVGDKYRLHIPYSLGYGEGGSPPNIPGFATLIFDVELLGINE